jgi:hypothetical protein
VTSQRPNHLTTGNLPLQFTRFFAQLSVFRGGWTLEAAKALSADFGSGLSGLGGGICDVNPFNPNTFQISALAERT